MAASPDASCLLELPFEVRENIYKQLLTDCVIHPCPDEHRSFHTRASTSSRYRTAPLPEERRRGLIHGDFSDDVMECSSRHYQSLIEPGKWSCVSSPEYDFKALDIVHFMLACKKTYIEIEPLLWSSITIAIGAPTFGTFIEQYLLTALRCREPAFVPRATALQKLILALPRAGELASEMGRDSRYHHLATYNYVTQAVNSSLNHLAKSCSSLHSVQIIMDATQFELTSDPHHMIVYSRREVENLLRLEGLQHLKVEYSGRFTSQHFDGNFSSLPVQCKNELQSCERALWEMVTGKGEPLDAEQDRTGWLGDYAVYDDEEPGLREFCQRTIRHYNVWWMSLSVDDKKAIYGDVLDNAILNAQAHDMSVWMLANQI